MNINRTELKLKARKVEKYAYSQSLEHIETSDAHHSSFLFPTTTISTLAARRPCSLEELMSLEIGPFSAEYTAIALDDTSNS